MLAEASGRYPGDQARLQSPHISTDTDSCLRFYYFMHGTQVEKLEVRLAISKINFKNCLNKSLSGQLGHWHNGRAFVFCPGDCLFKSEPSPTSADACGEVTGCTVCHQEVGMCSTRGGSQGMYITFTSTKKKYGRTHSGFETQRRHHQKSKTGVPVVPKRTCARQKI